VKRVKDVLATQEKCLVRFGESLEMTVINFGKVGGDVAMIRFVVSVKILVEDAGLHATEGGLLRRGGWRRGEG